MKTLTTIFILLAGVGLTLGQRVIPGATHNPGMVSFQNTETSKGPGVPGHLVTNVDGTLLLGTQYKAELFYLDTITSSLTPLPATISSFKASTTSRPGTWNGPAMMVPLPDGYGGVDSILDADGNLVEVGDGTGKGEGYYPVTLLVRVWDSTTGDSYQTATVIGNSLSFVYTQRFNNPPAPLDSQMLTQRAFQLVLVPEPASLALSVLGVAGLLFFRRRK